MFTGCIGGGVGSTNHNLINVTWKTKLENLEEELYSMDQIKNFFNMDLFLNNMKKRNLSDAWC